MHQLHLRLNLRNTAPACQKRRTPPPCAHTAHRSSLASRKGPDASRASPIDLTKCSVTLRRTPPLPRRMRGGHPPLLRHLGVKTRHSPLQSLPKSLRKPTSSRTETVNPAQPGTRCTSRIPTASSTLPRRMNLPPLRALLLSSVLKCFAPGTDFTLDLASRGRTSSPLI